tara:strand:+ start:158 stop:454 length:297 start_codon:yes stop_codon:yes gene_type:complete
MFTSIEELNKMVRKFWVTYEAASDRWSRPVMGIPVKTKNDVQRGFAKSLSTYLMLAKADGNAEVVEKIQNFAAGIVGEQDGGDGSETFKAMANTKEES